MRSAVRGLTGAVVAAGVMAATASMGMAQTGGGSAAIASPPPLACAKPTTPVDKTLCASADLKVAAEDVAAALREALANTPSGERDAVTRGQQAFLSERDRTCADRAATEACLRLYNKRIGDLQAVSSAGQKKLAAIATAIPKDPKAAAAALQRYDGPAAKAWLVYLLQAGLVTPWDKEGKRETLVAGLVAAIRRDLVADPDLREEVDKLGDLSAAPLANSLMLLRHVLSTTELDAPCFLFTKHGLVAFEAFGAFWNSSRDASPALCEPPLSVFDLPEWKKIEARMSSTAAPGQEFIGGLVRQNGGRQSEIDALQGSLLPASLLEAPQSEDAKRVVEQRKSAVAAFRAWRDFDLWPEADHKATVAALPAAIAATAKLYRETFKLAPAVADQAAHALADRFIASHISALMPDE